MHSTIIVIESHDINRIKRCVDSIGDSEIILIDNINAIKQVNIFDTKISLQINNKPAKLMKVQGCNLSQCFNIGIDMIDRENSKTVSFIKSNTLYNNYIKKATDIISANSNIGAVYSDYQMCIDENEDSIRVFNESFYSTNLIEGKYSKINPIFNITSIDENKFDERVVVYEIWDFIVSLSQKRVIHHIPLSLYKELLTIKDILRDKDDETIKKYILNKRLK